MDRYNYDSYESTIHYPEEDTDNKSKDLILKKRNELKNIITSENVKKEIEDFISENFEFIEYINDMNFDILINSIEKGLSKDEIIYIIENFKYQNLNFVIYDKEKNLHKVPLFLAIAKSDFEIADLLIERGADINFTIPDFTNGNIFGYLINITYNIKNNNDNEYNINNKNIKYIFSKNIKSINLNSKIILKFIEECTELSDPYSNNSYIELFNIIKTIFKEYIFDNIFISNLLSIFRNINNITKDQLELLIRLEKKRIEIDDECYSQSIENNRNDNLKHNLIKILFENDGSIPIIMAYRATRFKILSISEELKNKTLAKFVASYTKEYNNKEKYLKYLIRNYDEVNDNNRSDIRDLIEIELYKHDYKEDQYLNYILNIFIRNDKINLVKYLIESNDFELNINNPDHKHQYPILEALDDKNIKIFEYLLSQGVNCNMKNINGVPLLSLAIIQEQSLFVKHLLKKYKEEIDINAVDINNQTPLMYAIRSKRLSIVKKLIVFGKENNITFTNQKYIIKMAKRKSEKIYNYLETNF